MILDNICKRSYVGSTIDTMKIRMSNYKNHLKIHYKGCEMAQHFASCTDVHTLYSNDVINNRSRNFQNQFDSHLSNQIKIILIDSVDLSLAKTTKEKRELIEVHEGFWQTQLRTLSRYGGLNKKDERKISNSKRANSHKVVVSSSSSPDPQHEDREPRCSEALDSINVSVAPESPVTQSSPPTVRRSSRLRNKTQCNLCDQ